MKTDLALFAEAVKKSKRHTRALIVLILLFSGYGFETSIRDLLDSLNVKGENRSQYGFEDTGSPTGWLSTSDQESGSALSNPTRSDQGGLKGKWSLKVDVNLDGSGDGTSKGEVYVDPLFNHPAKYRRCKRFDRLDLAGAELSAVVKIPEELTPTDSSKPVRLGFFCVYTDTNGKEHREDFPDESINITSPGTKAIKAKASPHMTDVKRIGIKIGLNQGADNKDPDRNKYNSCVIFIDAVDWDGGCLWF